MKAFFITNVEIQHSFSYGTRNMRIANEFNDFKAELFPAVKGAEGYEIMQSEKIHFLHWRNQNGTFRELNKEKKYHEIPGIVGCFASHYLLWKKCVEMNELIGIFEYDAIQIRKMPKDYDFKSLLYLSSWRNFNNDLQNYHEDKEPPGIYPYIGYDRWGFHNVMSGTHAYFLKPSAARILIDTAKEKGWFPADRFMSTDIVPIEKETITPTIFKTGRSGRTTIDYYTAAV